MSFSVKSLITEAYDATGIVNFDDRDVDGSQAARGISILNEVLGNLNSDQSFPFQTVQQTFTIATGKMNYTLGTAIGSDFLTTEDPVFINTLFHQYSAQTNPLQVQQVGISELPAVMKPTGVGIPDYYSYNRGVTQGTLMFNRPPMAGSLVMITYTKPIPQATIDGTMAIPLEYRPLLVYSLARQLAARSQMPADTLANMDTLYTEAANRVYTLNARGQVPWMLPSAGSQNGNVLGGWW